MPKVPKRTQAWVAASDGKRPHPSAWWPAPVPRTTDLSVLRRAAERCTACPLCKDATQTVFGEGPAAAKIVLVGEQPGDQEDRAGRPFVGPAGKLLDRALADAGIDRIHCYVTNAVKHFKWEPRGSAASIRRRRRADVGRLPSVARGRDRDHPATQSSSCSARLPRARCAARRRG